VQLTHLVINKGVSLSIIGKVFLLYIPVLLGYTLPLACLTSVIMAFSRLSADNEIIAIRASGITLKQLLVPLFTTGIMLSLFTFLLNDRVIPYAYTEQRVMLKALGSKNPAALLEPGIFITAFENQVLFIHRIEDNKMYNVTIYQPQPDGKPTRTIIATRGEFSSSPDKNQLILKLINGTSDEPDLENPSQFYKLNFNTFFLTLDLSSSKKKVEKKPRGMTLRELRSERQRLQELLIDPARLDTEFFRKINWSLAPLIFILLGFPLAVITNKREKTANVFLAIGCAAGYYLMSLGCEALSIEHVLPAAIIMWLPNVIGASAAIVFNFKLLHK
jgi:lipopolysaccharide export system permease protein